MFETSSHPKEIVSALYASRIVWLSGKIDREVSMMVVSQLLDLERKDASADIHLYIDSPGGDLQAALAIYSTMQAVACDVVTLAVGECASAAAVILAAGSPGKRYSLPYVETMLHQPRGWTVGPVADQEAQLRSSKRLTATTFEILGRHTGRGAEKVKEDVERGDLYMSAQEAVHYGLIDKVYTKGISTVDTALHAEGERVQG